MKCSTVLVPAAFLSTLLLSARLPGDAVTFAPAAESSLAKTFEVKGSLSLDDLVAYINGEEQDPSMMGMPDEFAVDFGAELGITDTYAAIADGKPTDFARSFDTFRVWSESSDGEATDDEMDELVGKTARFVWNEEEGEYTRTFVDDEEADAETLDLVAVDMDLRALLPDAEVEDGDSWVVTGLPVFLVLAPGFDLEVALGDMSGELFEDVPEGVVDQMRSTLEGVEATCTYTGSADQDGASVAVIEFACTIDETIAFGPEALGSDAGMEMEDGGLELIIELEIKGECLWNTGDGHFSAFETEGIGTVGAQMIMSVPDMFELEANGELSIELNHSFSASME